MRSSLQQRCEVQIRNEQDLRKAQRLDFEQILKLSAMMYADAGCEVDVKHLKECKAILKGKAGFFSNFRGAFQNLILVKMAIADDANAYIDGVMAVYNRLRSGRMLPGEMLAMAATTIYDNCPAEALDEVVDKTRESHAKIKQQHRFLTDDSDMAIIALMVMAGKDPDEVAAQAEELFVTLKERFRIGSDAAQTVAMVLALSDKPTDQKIESFIGLYEACKEAGHATSKGKEMAIYAILADLVADRAELVAEIGEVDLWLKGKKGYGAFGAGASMRRLFAATLVVEDRQAATPAVAAGTTNAVTQAVVEELVLILIMIIVSVCIISASISSSH